MTLFRSSSLLIALCSVFLAACSYMPESLTQLGSSEPVEKKAPCQPLQDVFEKSMNGFQVIREKPQYHHKATLWQSRYQLIDNRCEIWQWSDKYSYICSKVMPDQETAETVYQKAAHYISQCLQSSPLDWKKAALALEGEEQEVQYSVNGRQRGSLKMVNSSGLFRDSWTVYFRVDSPNMLP